MRLTIIYLSLEIREALVPYHITIARFKEEQSEASKQEDMSQERTQPMLRAKPYLPSISSIPLQNPMTTSV
jgi:hypothetical protein